MHQNSEIYRTRYGRSSTVLASTLHSTVTFAASIGLDIEDIRAVIGQKALTANDPNSRVPDRSISDLWEFMISARPSDCLTIEMASSASFALLGRAAQGMQMAGSLLEALEMLCHYAPKLGDDLELSLLETGDLIVIEGYHPQEEKSNGRAGEPAVGLLFRIVKEVLGLHESISEIRLRSDSALGPQKDYEKFFRTPVVFRSKRNAIAFHRNQLFEKPNGGNRHSLTSTKASSQTSIEAARNQALSDSDKRLQDSIERNAAAGVFSVELAAVGAYMSVRSAQRVASKQGKTVTDMIEQVRLKMAKELLMRDQYSVETIAKALAYSEGRAFRRAFKRLTGLTPRDFRKHR